MWPIAVAVWKLDKFDLGARHVKTMATPLACRVLEGASLVAINIFGVEQCETNTHANKHANEEPSPNHFQPIPAILAHQFLQ